MPCCANERNFCVQRGETFHPTIRWGTGTLTTKAVTAIAKAAPARITAAGHGVPNGWPVAVTGAGGMIQINAVRFPPQGDDWHAATVLDADTVALDEVSSTGFSTYDTGGFLVYDTPQTLTGVTFNFSIYDNPGLTGLALHALTSAGGTVAVNDTLKTITPRLQTAGVTWSVGYYQLLATDAGGVVTELARGTITIE